MRRSGFLLTFIGKKCHNIFKMDILVIDFALHYESIIRSWPDE